jgi:hypothetical protein
MSEQPTDIDEERIRLTEALWRALGVFDLDLPQHPPVGQRHVLDATRGSILYTRHGHLYRVTLTVTAED